MATLLPDSAAECAAMLQEAAGRKQCLEILGAGSKRAMAGPIPSACDILSTTRLSQLLQYEPADLTISVEAGMRWTDLQKTLAANRQRIALNPPFASDATVGGVIATNGSGPARRAYGTARDLVIGMKFAVTQGRQIESGGMVVKNVAGLDTGKLMIGSLGTLGVITSVNFRVHAMPEQTRTFVLQFASLDECLTRRDAILQSVLQPDALDLFSPVAATRLGLRGYTLALRAGGSAKVLNRYARELPDATALQAQAEADLWRRVREFTADFLRRQPTGIVVRVCTTLSEMRPLLKVTSDAVVSRAAAGVNAVYLNSVQSLAPLWKAATENDWPVAIEFAPEDVRTKQQLCAGTQDNALRLMHKLKQMFDPAGILNPGRMFGCF